MPIPWLTVLDAFIGLTDVARKVRRRSLVGSEAEVPARRAGALGSIEARLAGVVVAALKEAFDRDSQRLDLERAEAEAARRRAERLLRLDLVRQAGDREIGRLRLLAGVAVASWLATLLFAAGFVAGGPAARVAFGTGWLLLLGTMAAAFAGQSRVAHAMDAVARQDAAARAEDVAHIEHDTSAGRVPHLDDLDDLEPVSSGAAGGAALWLFVSGLAAIGLGALLM